MNLFSESVPLFKIEKPIRLIETFAGIGAQSKALDILGLPYEHHKIVEWAYNSFVMYNMIHQKDFTDYSVGKTKEEMIERIRGVSTNYNEPLTDKQLNKKPIEWIKKAYNSCIATHNLVNIMDVHGEDLEITDTDKYVYILTYSFPCQDLSLAGKRKGMSTSQKDGGTRSGLLWEIERILDELKSMSERERESKLPQVLIMENVPEVIGTKNIKDFQKWEQKLASLGYANHVQILNGKDFGIPQNRKRTFMISILDHQSYEFPFKTKLKYNLNDMLEDKVDEKYYLSKKMIEYLTGINYKNSKYDRGKIFERNLNPNKTVANTITTRNGQRPYDNFITDDIKVVGNYGNGHHAKNVYDVEGVSPTITTGNHGLGQTILVKNATTKGYLEAEEGDGIDISTRMDSHRGTVQKGSSQTITCKGGENVGVVVKETLKERLCENLIESGTLQKGDIIKHSYTKQIMNGKKKAVEKQGEMITLTTRGDCFGIVVDDKSVFTETEKELFTEDGNIRRYIGSDKIDEFKEGQMATTTFPNGYGHGPRVHDESIALNTIDRPVVKQNLRIRKLTPLTCFKLMGFEQKDLNACREFGDAALYHVAGDSIITTVLVAIIGSMTDIDYVKKIEDYVETLKGDYYDK